MTNENDTMIEFKFARHYLLPACPCDVCGSYTDKQIAATAELDGTKLYVCERCLKHGNIDERLAKHAERMESGVRFLRSLIGRLRVPSYAEWRAAADREHEETDARIR
jgi:ribosome-binding protein aMBF1 (putative translation factor)